MKMVHRTITLGALLGLFLLTSCAGYEAGYSAKATEAWVVDAATGKPIEGVIAVAHWELSAGAMKARSRLVQLKVLETVTDKEGRLFFPAWGPERNPSMVGYIEDNDPGIILFKSGYAPRFLQNRLEARAGALRQSDWSGKTIALARAADNEEKYLREFQVLNQELRSIVEDASACNWKKIPRMLRAIYAERLAMVGKGLTGGRFGFGSVDLMLINNADRFSREGGSECGSPRDLFEARTR